MTLGGDGTVGYKWTDEQKKKQSVLLSGENSPCYGKKHTEDTKRKISESNKKTWEDKNKRINLSNKLKESWTEERKDKQREKMKKSNPMKGKKHKSSTIELMKKNNRRYRRKWTEEERENFNILRKGTSTKLSRKIYCDGLIFENCMICSEYYEVCYTQLRSALIGERPFPTKLRNFDIHYLDETQDEKNKREKIVEEIKEGIRYEKTKKSIYCNGIIFNTCKECANYYNVDQGDLSNGLNGKRKLPKKLRDFDIYWIKKGDDVI